MKGFTVICESCQTKSSYKEEEDRLLDHIKILRHHTGIRFICTKCEKQLDV